LTAWIRTRILDQDPEGRRQILMQIRIPIYWIWTSDKPITWLKSPHDVLQRMRKPVQQIQPIVAAYVIFTFPHWAGGSLREESCLKTSAGSPWHRNLSSRSKKCLWKGLTFTWKKYFQIIEYKIWCHYRFISNHIIRYHNFENSFHTSFEHKGSKEINRNFPSIYSRYCALLIVQYCIACIEGTFLDPAIVNYRLPITDCFEKTFNCRFSIAT
jgi:hypothetical protein